MPARLILLQPLILDVRLPRQKPPRLKRGSAVERGNSDGILVESYTCTLTLFLLMFSSCGELGHGEFTMMVASDFMSGFIGPWTYLVSMFFVSYSGRLVSDDDEVVVVSSCTQMGHTCKRT